MLEYALYIAESTAEQRENHIYYINIEKANLLFSEYINSLFYYLLFL